MSDGSIHTREIEEGEDGLWLRREGEEPCEVEGELTAWPGKNRAGSSSRRLLVESSRRGYSAKRN